MKLRTAREEDLYWVVRWNMDLEVMVLYDGSINARSREEIESHYRDAQRQAHAYMVEHESAVIGEARIYVYEGTPDDVAPASLDRPCCIEFMIGEKKLWRRGLGTELVRLLETTARQLGYGAIIAFDVNQNNAGCRSVLEKLGFQLYAHGKGNVVHYFKKLPQQLA